MKSEPQGHSTQGAPSLRNAHDTACSSSFCLEDWETWLAETETDSDNDDI